MLLELTPRIQAVILDMDGVLWRANTPVVDIPAVFERFNHLGLRVALATNNATRSVSEYQEKLAGLGAHIEAWQIINSPLASAHLLHKEFPQGGPVYVVGAPGLLAHLEEFGFYYAEEKTLAVVAGLDMDFTYKKMAIANRLIRQGARFIGTNPDVTYPLPDGLAPGAGAVLAAIEAASGVSPTIAGKPQPVMYELALERMQVKPEEAIGIGDRLDTDILGAQNAGCRTGLVMSGVSTSEDLQRYHPKPDLVAADLWEMIKP
jgi:4-nitrophenyl phosphatase